MSTSNSYTFGTSITVDEIVKESFERCGFLSDTITALQLDSAKRSLNLICSNWVNRGLNLWAVDQQMLKVIPGQASYPLPTGTIDVITDEATSANFTRQLGGTPASSSGNASFAFDGNPLTACTQTAPNGWISYDFGLGNSYSVNAIGIQSNNYSSYSFAIQYSFDNATWFNAVNPIPQTYIFGQITWLLPVDPIDARYWRVIETSGNTINMQELYFSLISNSKNISRIARATYLAISNKNLTSDTTSFLVNRQINPTITLWPTPMANPSYAYLVYNRKRAIQDMGASYYNIDVPQRFLEALVLALAASLALKFATDKFPQLNALADDAYTTAAMADTESVPTTFMPDLSRYS